MNKRSADLFSRWSLNLRGSGGLAADARIHREFERWVVRTPDAPAVIGERCSLSYRELNERANQLASYLRERGVGPGSIVATCFERSVEMVIGQLGVLKTGGAYLPLVSDFPAERVRFMLRDSGVRLILAQRATLATLPAGAAEIVCLDDDWARISAGRAEQLPGRDRGGNLACVVYTSGSTGQPKGVLIAHRGVVRLATKQDYATFRPGRRFLLLASPGFDAVFFEVWGPLMSGGSCVIFEGRWPELHRLETVIRDCGVTCVFLTTSLFNQIVDLRPEVLDAVSEILVGGEALSVAHVRRAQARLPGARLSNIYGPTECTTFACAGEIAIPQMWGCTSVPIGRPIGHTECHVVDAMLRPVPVGEPGELLLGGAGLALGYLNQPQLTGEKFIRHPWSDDDGARLYRTGDLCRWLPNGFLEFVGRMDDQIKVRGFRIEPAEIESLAQACEGVANAVAAVVGSPGERRPLIVFVVPRPGVVLEPEAIRQALRLQLPEPMVPGCVEIVASIPLTMNGKADRAALLAGWEAGGSRSLGFRPGDECEARLTRWWRKLLQRAELGADDDFFREGGDSLLAAQLALELQRELGRPVPVGAIFAHPTPAKLAAHLRAPVTSCALQGSGAGAPLFYVPEIHGVGRLSPFLIQRLSGQRRYYDGLQFPGVSDGDPLERVEDVADALLAQVAAVYPEGPLCLYGFSFGGLVAYEMARRLAQQGRAVEIVVVGDVAPASEWTRRGPWERKIWRVLDVLRPPWRGAPRKIVGLVRSVQDRISGVAPGKSSPLICRTRVALASHRAYGAYIPGAYSGRVALVKFQEKEFSSYRRNPPSRDYGWSRYVASALTVRSLRGKHEQIFEDEACAVVSQLLAAVR